MADGGFMDRVKGKAKEVAGELAGRDDLAREGRLQRAHGSAQREAERLEGRAEREVAQADVQAERDRLALEAERIANEERTEAREAEIERRAEATEARVLTEHEQAARTADLAAARAEGNAEALRDAREERS